MSDGDFGGDDGSGDDGGHDGGAFDLNHNGTSADELILFALITDGEGAARRRSGRQGKGSGCLLPAVLLPVLALALLALLAL